MALAFIFGSAGVGEWIVLLAVLLVIVGPKNLPDMARKAGRYYSRLSRAANAFKRQLLEMDMEPPKPPEGVPAAFTMEGDESKVLPSSPPYPGS